jgi:hypothetical protein
MKLKEIAFFIGFPSLILSLSLFLNYLHKVDIISKSVFLGIEFVIILSFFVNLAVYVKNKNKK